ncbi:MAG: type II secretion system protein [Candidatus Pacebacteria bacterium]|nr:type II secretion system protein [Candidatus Paceibacterota bacterium]
MRTSRGFTLIELLVVIAIIGILSSVIMVGLGDARTKSKYAAAAATSRSVQKGAGICLSEGLRVCLPGETVSGVCAAASTLDTITGGGGVLCAGYPAKYERLPQGWVWCDSISSGNCGSNTSVQTTSQSFFLRLMRTADNTVITCVETKCTCTSGNCPVI